MNNYILDTDRIVPKTVEGQYPGPSGKSRTDFTCNQFELIVTHTNVLAFEETYLKAEEDIMGSLTQ